MLHINVIDDLVEQFVILSAFIGNGGGWSCADFGKLLKASFIQVFPS